MKNLSCALVVIASIGVYALIREWWLLVLGLFIALLFAEFMPRIGKDLSIKLLQAQINETEARGENLRWQTELSKAQVKINLMTLTQLQKAQRR